MSKTILLHTITFVAGCIFGYDRLHIVLSIAVKFMERAVG